MKKILIIEDDPVAGHLYRTRLTTEGYAVEVATDGQSGFDRLLELHPDGLLLDLMLPKTSGIELLRKIRATDGFENLPVITFTNAFIPSMIDEAREAGATKVFDKFIMTPVMLAEAFRVTIRAAEAEAA
jgi:CheY-like chemotaxis protein